MPGIEREGVVFLEALLSGMIVSMAYICIRKFRRVIKHNLAAITIEDLFFWLGTAIYLFVQIYHTSDGSIRWYFVLGVVLGAVSILVIDRVRKKMNKKLYVDRKVNSEKSIDKKKEKR